MQDLEQLKEHQEYQLTKLMINGVVRQVASEQIKLMINGVVRQVASEQINLDRLVDIDEESDIMTHLKVCLKDKQGEYIRFVVFHYPSTNTVDISYASFEDKKRVNYRELNKVDVNNLYNLLMQVINEVIPCQQQ